MGKTILFYSFFMIFALSVYAADDNSTLQSTKQNIGGLIFDVDEGVKIEKGGGGSVYVQSNREYMQQKFRAIERRLTDIEERVTELEKNNPPPITESTGPTEDPDARRVLLA